MSKLRDNLWVNKYRPKSIKDLILPFNIRKPLTKFLREKEIPHLLLAGPPGCGKTSYARIIFKTLDCSKLYMNASNERGIDVMRNKIIPFCASQSINKWKIIFMDEADQLTKDAQELLRSPIELYSSKSRFIFACNNKYKLTDAIISRCQEFNFPALKVKKILNICRNILEQEEINYNIDDLLILIEDYEPDIRKIIHHLQLNCEDGKFTYETAGLVRDDIIELIMKKDMQNIRQAVEQGIDTTETIKTIFYDLENYIDDFNKLGEISVVVAEYLYREFSIPDKNINFIGMCFDIINRL